MVAEWWNGGVVEWNMVDCDGVVESWNREIARNGGWWLVMEWWFGGCTKSCLCVSFSGVLVMISGLGYVGVHEDNHHRGRPCAGAIGFSIENGTTSVGVSQKIRVVPARNTWPANNAVHETQ